MTTNSKPFTAREIKPNQGDDETSPEMNFIDDEFFSGPKQNSPLQSTLNDNEIEAQLPEMVQIFDSHKPRNLLNVTSKMKVNSLDLSSDM